MRLDAPERLSERWAATSFGGVARWALPASALAHGAVIAGALALAPERREEPKVIEVAVAFAMTGRPAEQSRAQTRAIALGAQRRVEEAELGVGPAAPLRTAAGARK